MQAFSSYDSLEGARCQTVPEPISQKDAALRAVRRIGLNQIREIDKDRFEDESIRAMFFERPVLLKAREAGEII